MIKKATASIENMIVVSMKLSESVFSSNYLNKNTFGSQCGIGIYKKINDSIS